MFSASTIMRHHAAPLGSLDDEGHDLAVLAGSGLSPPAEDPDIDLRAPLGAERVPILRRRSPRGGPDSGVAAAEDCAAERRAQGDGDPEAIVDLRRPGESRWSRGA